MTIKKTLLTASLANALTFKAKSQHTPDSAGVITGQGQNTQGQASTFTSTQTAYAPKATQNGIIQGASWHPIEGNYGFTSGNRTVCYYAYNTKLNSPTYLIMPNV